MQPALDLYFHPKQWLAFDTAATEILYGGASGGGKSHMMRIAAIIWAAAIPGLQVYLFRRVREDLLKNHMEGPKGFRELLAAQQEAGWVDLIEDEIRWWNGSRIFLCHCQHEQDRFKYQGAEIHVLMVDEITHFTESIYRFLRNRTRMIGINVPEQYDGMFPRIVCGGNPGNIGHLWVKNCWVSGAVPLRMRKMPSAEGGMIRQFIPARLEDNPSMTEDDPGYEARLEGLGSQALVQAMRWGNWDVIEGAYFDCWSYDRHVVPPFAIPKDWVRFRSADWGSASPFSVGWWAVAQDDFHLPLVQSGREDLSADALLGEADAGESSNESEPREPSADRGGGILLPRGGNGTRLRDGAARAEPASLASGRTVTIPRGALVRYREDYGDLAGTAGKGLKLTAEQVADRIILAEMADPKLSYAVLDPSAFKEDGGPSIAERINTRLLKAKMAPFRPADNSRVTQVQGRDRRGPMGGWDQLRGRMVGNGETPTIFCFSTCLDSIRTIPVLQHDPHKAEDLDTNSEDHAADEWRYACMSRPWLRSKEEPKAPTDGYRTPTEEFRRLGVDDWKTM